MYFDQNKNIDIMLLVFFLKCRCEHGRGVYSIVDIFINLSVFLSLLKDL